MSDDEPRCAACFDALHKCAIDSSGGGGGKPGKASKLTLSRVLLIVAVWCSVSIWFLSPRLRVVVASDQDERPSELQRIHYDQSVDLLGVKESHLAVMPEAEEKAIEPGATAVVESVSQKHKAVADHVKNVPTVSPQVQPTVEEAKDAPKDVQEPKDLPKETTERPGEATERPYDSADQPEEAATEHCNYVLSRINRLRMEEKRVQLPSDNEIFRPYAQEGDEVFRNGYSANFAGVPVPMNYCRTYQERYGPYGDNVFVERMITSLRACRRRGPSKTVLLMRSHINRQFSEDLRNHINSMIAELGWMYGMDVVLLVHINEAEGDMDESQMRERLERSSIPRDLWPIAELFTPFDLWRMFPRETYNQINDHGHMSFVWYMEKHPEYKYMFVIEDDVRYTGRWNELLEQAAAQYRLSRSSKPFDPKESQGRPPLPDLLSFGPFVPSQPDWYHVHSCEHIWPMGETVHALGVVWGLSDRATSEMARLFKEGKNCYYEAFVPTAMSHSALSYFYSPHLDLRKDWAGSYSCCEFASPHNYLALTRWRISNQCFPNILFHPFKA